MNNKNNSNVHNCPKDIVWGGFTGKRSVRDPENTNSEIITDINNVEIATIPENVASMRYYINRMGRAIEKGTYGNNITKASTEGSPPLHPPHTHTCHHLLIIVIAAADQLRD